MKSTIGKRSYHKQLEKLRILYDAAKESTNAAKESTKEAEKNLNAAKDNETKALDKMSNFVKKSFVRQLKDFFDGAPVVITVFNHDKNHELPPEDEPDKYGVRILPSVLQEDSVFVHGEYASVNPKAMDFMDIYHGKQPWFRRYDDYYPSFCNIIFLSDSKDHKWIKERYIPVKDFSVIKKIMERNHKLYMQGLIEEVNKLKSICPKYKAYSANGKDCSYIFLMGQDSMEIRYREDSFLDTLTLSNDDPLGYRWLDKKYERKEISTNAACDKLDGIIRGNRKYYRETVTKARKWFAECAKLVAKQNTKGTKKEIVSGSQFYT